MTTYKLQLNGETLATFDADFYVKTGAYRNKDGNGVYVAKVDTFDDLVAGVANTIESLFRTTSEPEIINHVQSVLNACHILMRHHESCVASDLLATISGWDHTRARRFLEQEIK